MDSIPRNIADLAADERSLFERFIGQPLTDGQRVIVRVLNDAAEEPAPTAAADYAILSDMDDAEAQALVEAITKRSPGRDVAL